MAAGALVALAAPVLALGAAAVELEPVDRQQLEAGGTVLRTRIVADWPWPEMIATRRVAAASEEVMAVYADFAGHTRWMPRVAVSQVVTRPAAATFRVFYEYETPGPNERYTVNVRLAHDGRAWEAAWTLVEARYARRLGGSLRVQPWEGGALVTYVNRVDPGALGVALGSPETTLRRLADTVEALTARVADLRQREPARLAELVRALPALAGGGDGTGRS